MFRFGENRRICREYDRYMVSYMYTVDIGMADSVTAPNPRNENYMALDAYIATLPGPVNGMAAGKDGSTAPTYPKVVMRGGLRSRTIPKPDIMSQVASPKSMAELDEGLDNLIRKDGLDKLGIDELSTTLAVSRPGANEYTAESLMDKILEANNQPQEQPDKTVDREKDVLMAQAGAEEKVEEEQQIL